MAQKFIMLIGISGSGKSTYGEKYAREIENCVIVSSDKIREELFGDEAIQGDNTKIFAIANERIFKTIKSGKTVVFDATNINGKHRRALLKDIKRHYNITTIACVIATPYEKCLERNAGRNRKVPEEVIKRQMMQFSMPIYDEGWNEIEIVYPQYDATAHSRLLKEMQIPQDNPHHTLSVYEHCDKAAFLAQQNHEKLEVTTALMWHDCGKPFCKRFTNAKGQPTKEAHYYNHERVSAYMFLTMVGPNIQPFSTEQIIYITKLIEMHMVLYANKTDEQVEKLIRQHGNNIILDLFTINRYDKAAK